MAALYAIAAWLIMQVAEVLIDLADLPDWIGPAVLGLLAVGLPIALVVSWFYELTPEGVSLEKHVDAADSITHVTGRRMDFIVISLLSAAVLLFAWHTWWPSVPADKSIAVMPFKNMSDDPEQEYFSDGISEELLNKLAKVADLRVISRSSSFSFKGKDVDIPTVAKKLNVGHILEGSVRRMGDNVRITAQLIDASTDSHKWSETYDRELTTQNIFAIQSEIAAVIADKLRATLLRWDEENLKNVPTMSLEAYQAYLLGKQRMISRSSASLKQAAADFQRAIDIDSDYALAYVGLAETYMLLGDYAGLSLREMLSNSEPALSKALKLDDELAEAYVAKGAVRSKAGDIAAAEDAFRRAIELDSNYSKAYHWYGDVLLNRLQQPETALPMLQKAYQLDPVSPALIVTLGQALDALGRFEEAMEVYQQALEIEPAYASTYYLIGGIHALEYGRLDQGVRWSLEGAARDPRYVTNLAALGSYFLALGDDAQAEQWINRAMSIGPDRFQSNSAMAFLFYYQDQESDALNVARRLQIIAPGNNTTLYMLVALARYQEALGGAAAIYPEFSCDREPDVTRRNLFPAINFSLALQEAGDPECANRLLEEALKQMQNMPRLGLYGFGIADVEVYARQGKTQRALATLRRAIDQGWRATWWAQGERSPHTVSLRDEPEFQAMIDEIRSDMVLQLKHLRAMEVRGELALPPP